MSARSIATLQTGVDDVYVEVDALQILLRSITDELLKSSLLDDFKEGIQGKLDSLMGKLESITTRTAAQQADLQELGKRLQELQVRSAAVSNSHIEHGSRTMPSAAGPASSRFSEGGGIDAVPVNSIACKKKFRFVSWNAQKRPPGRLRQVLKELRHKFGCDTYAFLQEVPRWGVTACHQLAVRSVQGCDCAIDLPRNQVDSILWERHDKTWSLVVVSTCILVSAHILDYGQDRAADSPTLRDISAAIKTAEEKVRMKGQVPILYVGIDANVTLPPHQANITGGCTAQILPSHRKGMQCTLLDLLRTHCLKVHNTFGSDLDPTACYTKVGRKRSAQQKSQIYFLCSSTSASRAWPDLTVDSGTCIELRKSDHLPVCMTGEIDTASILPDMTPINIELRRLQKRWDLGSSREKVRYWRALSCARDLCNTVQDCIKHVKEAIAKEGAADEIADLFDDDYTEIDQAVDRRKRRKL